MSSHSKYTVFRLVALLTVLLVGLTSLAYAEVDGAKRTELLNKVSDKLAEADKSEDTVPEGLTASSWKGIRQAYERHRHAAVAVDGEFRARNPGQQWLTHFDGRGFVVKPDAAKWRWGLELQSYGFPGHQRTVSGQAKITAKNDRVTYDWNEGLKEWFVNDRNGLEHGFTINNRPPSSHPSGAGEWLEFRLSVRGDLRAQGHTNGQGVSFVNKQGSTVVNYAGLKVWDADHRKLPARIEADATGLRLTVDERSARYPLTIDPIAQQAYLKASNTDAFDEFGFSVAVSGDTVVVGARMESSIATGVNGNQADNSGGGSGAAYVFVRDGGGVWSQQAYLKASNTDGVGDAFGISVAVSGDTIVVGAHRESSNATGINGNQADNSASGSGAAYVFVRDGGGVWSQQAYLKASNTGSGDGFGRWVAVSGDTIVVAATLEDSNATGVNGNQADNSAGSSGAAYVFFRDGVAWSQQAYLKASNTDANDQFGNSVAVSGNTVVVGAWHEDSNATGVNGNQTDNGVLSSGAAYVFLRDSGGTWSQQAYLKASNTDAGDWFGRSVAVSGDTIVVAADREDSNATGINGNQANNGVGSSGAAYVFVRDGAGVWSQQAYLKASNTGSSDQFGFSVALSGDTVVTGAPFEDSNVGDSGAAYVFVRNGVGVWSQQAFLRSSNTGGGDDFGWLVAVSGDTVVVGARFEDSNATGINGNQADNNAGDSGAAYVFLITPPPPIPPVLAAAPHNLPKQKYISIDASTNGSRLLAIKIEETTTGNIKWVGAPNDALSVDARSVLVNAPVIIDWSSFTVVNMTGCIIQPFGEYEITFVDDPLGASVSSAVLPASATCAWGDVQVTTIPPACEVGIGDIVEGINIATGGGAFPNTHADLQGDVANGELDIADIVAIINSATVAAGETPPGYTPLIDCP